MSKISNNRHKAFRNQAGRCFYCNVPMCEGDPKLFAAKHGISLADAKRLQSTAEHLQARCDGGKDSIGNIVAACLHCNQRRHARKRPLSPDEFRAHVRKRIAQERWHSPRIHARFFKEHKKINQPPRDGGTGMIRLLASKAESSSSAPLPRIEYTPHAAPDASRMVVKLAASMPFGCGAMLMVCVLNKEIASYSA